MQTLSQYLTSTIQNTVFEVHNIIYQTKHELSQNIVILFL